jgi:hypothetical protein
MLMNTFTDAVRDDTSLRALLFELCAVDTAAGVLVWKTRPAAMFSSQRACDSWNTRFAGKEAGSTNKRGYREVHFAGRLHLRHRLIWLAEHGVMPIMIDHERGVEAGDGIGNLRQTDQPENMKNLKMQKRNKTGHPGVTLLPTGKYRAAIRSDNVSMHLGHFDSVEDAIAARKKAERLYGFHPNHGRKVA